MFIALISFADEVRLCRQLWGHCMDGVLNVRGITGSQKGLEFRLRMPRSYTPNMVRKFELLVIAGVQVPVSGFRVLRAVFIMSIHKTD